MFSHSVRLTVLRIDFLSTLLAPSPLSVAFRDTVVISELMRPTVVRFSPDGRIFVAEKSGIIKVYASLTSTPTIFTDLTSQVDNYPFAAERP